MGGADAAKRVVDHQAEAVMRVPVRQGLCDRGGLAVDLDVEHISLQQCHDMHRGLRRLPPIRQNVIKSAALAIVSRHPA
jgi:hypothetical protein